MDPSMFDDGCKMLAALVILVAVIGFILGRLLG